MWTIKLPLRGGYHNFDIPVPKDRVSVLQCKDPKPAKETEEIVRTALRHPYGSPALSHIGNRGDRAVVLFDDWTRPTPIFQFIHLVVEELRAGGIRDKDILLMCANGMHAPEHMSEAQLVQKIGEKVFDQYKVLSHDAYDGEQHKFIGFTRTLGTPVLINRQVAEANIKVAVGRIAPHREFGYSGGGKMMVPGVASVRTIMHNHALSLPRLGVYGNPVREDIDECSRMAGLNFIVNVVCNSNDEVVGAVAGDPVEAHQAGVQFGDREVWGASASEKAEIVIAAPGLHKDRYFYTSLRCLHNADRCLRKDGTVILTASCDNGWTDQKYLERKWQVSEDILEHSTEDLIDLVESREWCTPQRQFQALVFFVQNTYRLCHEMEVCIAGASDICRKYAEKLGLHWFDTVDAALEQVISQHTAKAGITIIPDYFITPIPAHTGTSAETSS